MKKEYDLIVITGPTATGKTGLAVSLASELHGEIISADSRQVYRGMTIGTGKDLDDYSVNGKMIPYHLIDICDAGEEYNLFRYKNDFRQVYSDIKNRGILPVLCGGSGLYIEAVLKDYTLLNVPVNESLREELRSKSDIELEKTLNEHLVPHNISDTSNRKRLIRAIEIAKYQKDSSLPGENSQTMNYIIFAIDFDRPVLKKRITERLRQRLKYGMIEETRSLLEKGITQDKLIYYGLEYKFLAKYLDGQYNYNDMFQKLNSAIHRFSKRQMTWFRKMERDGIKINWIDGKLSSENKLKAVLEIMENNNE
jgi:tRNA dimethylallyltransferase